MQTIKNNKLYFLIIGALCALSYLLNHCLAIYQCAVVFTAIAIIVNASTSIYGRAKTIKGLATALIMSFALLWKLPYYIDGKIMNGLVLASFISVMISLYWSTLIFQKIQSNFSFVKSNFISLLFAFIVDGFVMGVFFVINNNFTYARIIEIFAKEVSFKVLYGFIASALIAFTLNALQNNRNLKTMN
jgi:hypothetical protein